MLTDLWTFLETKWNFITSNSWTFIIFGTFFFLIGLGVHRYFVEIKIHNIPEREALKKEIAQLKKNHQKVVDQLQEDNNQLKALLHKKTIAEEVEEFKASNKIDIGAVIAKNKTTTTDITKGE